MLLLTSRWGKARFRGPTIRAARGANNPARQDSYIRHVQPARTWPSAGIESCAAGAGRLGLRGIIAGHGLEIATPKGIVSPQEAHREEEHSAKQKDGQPPWRKAKGARPTFPRSSPVISQVNRRPSSRGSPFRFQAGSALIETEAGSEKWGIVPAHWLTACRTRSNQRPTPSLIWPAVAAPGSTGVSSTVCNSRLLAEGDGEEIDARILHHPGRGPHLELADAQVLNVLERDGDRRAPGAGEGEVLSASSCSSPLQVKMRAVGLGKQSRIRAGVLK